MEATNTTVQEKEENLQIRDNSGRAKALLTVFWILAGITLVAIISDYLQIELLKKARLNDFIDESEAGANDLRQRIVGLLQTGLFIISVVVFLNWFRRAYGNLHRLGISYRLEHKESMAVWAWFIPIISLFRPVRIMSEIWTETQKKIKQFDASYITVSGGLVIGLWWTLFIISNFIGRYILSTAFKQDTLEQLIAGSQAIMVSDIMEIPEALLVILIVYRVSKMETRLAREVKRSGGTVICKE